jgi:hypothetical protein
MNNVSLFKNSNNQLELVVNGISVKSDFTTEIYDSTTRSEISDFILSSEGQNRLDGSYPLDGTINILTYDNNDLYDGTNQFNILYIDKS